MKNIKMLFGVFVFTVLMAGIPGRFGTMATVYADEQLGDWTYTYDSTDRTATITGYTGTGTNLDITIPSILGDYTVTDIGYGAFSTDELRDKIKSVTIPADLNIGESAFQGLTTLERVTFAGDVDTIGAYAFSGCSNLRSVSFGGDVYEIKQSAFGDCSSLTGLTFDGLVTYIEENVIGPNTPLETLTFNCSVITIGERAFAGTSLESVTFGDTVYTIGERAFSGCTSLESVTFSYNVTQILDYAFTGCYALENLTFPGNVGFIGQYAFSSCTSLGSATFEGAVGTIGGYVFDGCTSLEGVTFKGNVDTIGQEAFYGNISPSLIRMDFLGNVGTIGKYAFRDNLSGLIFNGSVTTIEEEAFYGCRKMIDIVLTGVESIGTKAFCNCARLKDIHYSGTEVEWAAVQKGQNWDASTPDTQVVHCKYSGTVAPNDENRGKAEAVVKITNAGTDTPTVTVIATATKKEGYAFINWTEGDNVVSTDAVYEFAAGGGRTLTANFDEQLTVTFNKNADGATGNMDDQVVIKGVETALAPNGFAYADHTFKEWNTKADGSGKSYADKEKITADGNVELFAQWNANKYSVKIQTEGKGTATADPKSAVAGTKISIKATPNEGCEFKKWKASDGVKIKDDTAASTSFTMPNDNVTVTAVFEEIRKYAVDVTADPANGGTVKSSVSSGKSGTKVTITAMPGKDFLFKEWKVVSGGVELADSKQPETTFIIKNADVKVKAIFEVKKADTYTVTVTTDGHGTAKATPASGKEGKKVTIKAVSKAGYEFKKWKVISGGVKLADPTKAKTTFKIKKANVKVKAIFEKIIEEPQPEIKPVGDDKITIAWWKVDEAKGYDIFMSRCNHDGKEIKPKLVKTIKGNKTFSWTATGLKPNRSYKALVKAYVKKDGKKKYISVSPLMHVYTAGGTKNYTNAKSIKLDTSDGKIKKSKLKLNVKDTYKIKASVKKADKKRKLMPATHVRTLRYRSSDPGIATVSKSGKITAKRAGKCKIYVYAHNGVNKTINLTVK